MKKILLFFAVMLLAVSAISLVSAQSNDCNFWCRLGNLFSGNADLTGRVEGGDIPEFTSIGAGLAIAGSGLGYWFIRSKRK